MKEKVIKPKDSQSPYWMVTEYDMTKKLEDSFNGQYVYLVYQKEKCPDTGRLHYQGYVCFKARKRLSQLKVMSSAAHFELRRGKHAEAKAYCMKSDSRQEGPWEFGSDADIPDGKGERKDLEEIKEMLDEGKTLEDIAEAHFGDFCRYRKSFQTYKDMLDEKRVTQSVQSKFANAVLRPWQTSAYVKLSSQNDRGVLWIYDEVGGKGKSFFAKWLEANKDAYLITSGKHADIYYAYNYQPIVVMDIARTHSMDKSMYEMIESFKNGRVFSSKYESKSKRFDSAKVIIFANFEPDRTMLSNDRIDLIKL